MERLVSGHKLSGFNPRSRKGNDADQHRCIIYLLSFNPRSRKGNDGVNPTGVLYNNKVSIHVPARGTTQAAV